MILWVKAFHLIFVICWFAGLFYLPRLMVYHASIQEGTTHECFKTMERRLYYGIMWPAAILTTIFGFWLISFNFSVYMAMGWIHIKLALVLILWVYHLYCGHCIKDFKANLNQHSAKFYRILNEVPTVLLVVIVILAIVKP